MKTIFALLLCLSSTATIAAGINPHRLAVRLNGLDSLSRIIFPPLAAKMGLDHLRVGDQVLLDTHWNGYQINVSLRQIKGKIPFSASPPYANALSAAFGPGNTLTAALDAPDARFTMKLQVGIRSKRWYQPGIGTEFQVTGKALTAQASVGLALAGGDFVAKSYGIPKLEIGSVEVENIALLSKLFGTVLRHTSLCGGARSLEDCLTRTVNKQLARLVTPGRFLKPLVDPMLYELSGAAHALFTRNDTTASSYASLINFETLGNAATFDWGVQLSPIKKQASCAVDLSPGTRPGLVPFDWNRAATGDLEVALPLSLVENYLYLVGRQGDLCVAAQTTYRGVKLDLEFAPTDSIALTSNNDGTGLVLDVPFRAKLKSAPGERAKLEAEDLRGTLEIKLDFAKASPKGLCLVSPRVAINDLAGSVRFSGVRIPLFDVQAPLEEQVSTALSPRLEGVCILPKTTPLNDLLALKTGEQAEASAAHAWTSFEFQRRQPESRAETD